MIASFVLSQRPLATSFPSCRSAASAKRQGWQPTGFYTERHVTHCYGTSQSAEQFYEFLLDQQASIIQVSSQAYAQVLQTEPTKSLTYFDSLLVANRGPGRKRRTFLERPVVSIPVSMWHYGCPTGRPAARKGGDCLHRLDPQTRWSN